MLILLAIAVPSIKLLAAQYAIPKPDLTVKVIGHQWYWSYQYPDNGDFEVVSNILTEDQDKAKGEPRQLGVDNRMVVPAGAVVKVITTSDDVIHSFAVPRLLDQDGRGPPVASTRPGSRSIVPASITASAPSCAARAMASCRSRSRW